MQRYVKQPSAAVVPQFTIAMSSKPDTAAGVPSALLLPLQLLPMGPNYGALLVGTFLSLMCVAIVSDCLFADTNIHLSLYGVELHQVYRYIRLYGRDHVFLKCYVSSGRICCSCII